MRKQHTTPPQAAADHNDNGQAAHLARATARPALAALLLLTVGLASTAAGQQPTTSWLDVYPNPAEQGAPVTIRATVNAELAWPTGSFSLWDDTSLVAEQELEPGGSCAKPIDSGGARGAASCSRSSTFMISTLTAGTHSLTATYNGDADTLPSTTDPVLLVVLQPVTPVPILTPAATLALVLLLFTTGCLVIRRTA